jgi:N-acetylneuraminate lyase
VTDKTKPQLIAATFTPMNSDGVVTRGRIKAHVEHLVNIGLDGIYVLGSTGEGLSLTNAERMHVAEAFVKASADRLRVIIQVGHESLMEAAQLAIHAQHIGASAISAVSPIYFKPRTVDDLVQSIGAIASGAPDLPFYYYHIPAVTGLQIGMVEFMERAGNEIPNFKGIKYTAPTIDEFKACVEFSAGRYEMYFGLDEMLLSGLAAGADGAVGSTYNFAGPIYIKLIEAFMRGDMETAQALQNKSIQLVDTFIPFGPREAQKAIMKMVGVDCGPARLPLRQIADADFEQLHDQLKAIGFFAWIKS